MSILSMFLRSPDADVPVASVYRQVLPYGPYQDASGPKFSPGWTIEIDPTQSNYTEIHAVTDGVATVIPDESGRDIVRLALTPFPLPTQQLNSTLGAMIEIPSYFIYSNVDGSTLPTYFSARIQAAPNPQGLSFQERLQRFMTGADSIDVGGGEPIGKPAPASDGIWLRVTLEVVSRDDNRLDPVVFYAVAAAHAAALLAPADQDNSVVLLATPRILLEARTEHNTPYAGTVRLTDGGSQLLEVIIPSAHRGHLELPAGWAQYTLSVASPPLTISGRRITELPDGQTASTSVTRTLTPPWQWIVQSVDPDDWFADPVPPYAAAYALPKYTEGNRVTPLIDGIETFEAMWQEFTLILTADHFAYLAVWWLQDDFALVPGNLASRLVAITAFIDSVGASVRALVWMPNIIAGWLADNLLLHVWPNRECADRINQLTNGKAILDHRTGNVYISQELYTAMLSISPVVDVAATLQPIGSHHQKFIVINNHNGLVAFCGGIDPKCNRLQLPGHYSPPRSFDAGCTESGYHDVHCKVEGPAASDFLRTFRLRWNDHPDSPPGDTLAGTPPLRSPRNSHFVQVARTFGAGVGYVFAPDGDRTIFEMIRRAITNAEKYIYIEDQYVISIALRDLLIESLDRIKHVTIVLAKHVTKELPYKYWRHEFIAPLRQAGGDKVRVFSLRNLKGESVYVHSKMMVIDDIFITIGSANVDRRGYTFDSEINVAALDGQVEAGARKLARDLRIRLWAEHLGFYNPFTNRYHHLDLLDDPVAAAGLWFRDSPLNQAEPYDETVDLGDTALGEATRLVWDAVIDPDARLAP